MDIKYKRLFSNTAWTLVGNMGSKLVAFFLLPFYTKWLGTEGYGLSDLISTYSGFFLGLVTLCTADAIFVFTKNASEEEKRTYFSSVFLLDGCLFVIWGIVFYVIFRVSGEMKVVNSFTSNIWYVFAIIVTSFLQNYSQQFVIGLSKIKIYSFAGLVLCLNTFILSLFLIPEFGVEGYILALVFSNLLTTCYSFFVSESYKYLKFSKARIRVLNKVLRYSIPLIPNAMMWWLVQALNRPLLEKYVGISDIGIYAVANKFPGIITMVFGLFAVSWNISVFEEYNKPTYSSFYSNVFKTLFLGISVCCILLMVFSPMLIRIFAAPEFYEAWKYMIILIFGSFFSCLSSFFGTNFSVVKESKYFFYSSVWGAVTSVILNFILIPNFGLLGACISVVASFGIMALSRYIYSIKYVSCCLFKDTVIYTMVLFLIVLVILCMNNIYGKMCIVTLLTGILIFINRKQIEPLFCLLREKL